MRVTILANLFLALGAIAMSEQSPVVADEKKADPKKDPKTRTIGGITYNEKVTVRVWSSRTRPPGFLKPSGELWARRLETKKGLMFDVFGTSTTEVPAKGSEITDKAGNVYLCIEVESPPQGCFVKLKTPAPKRP